MNNKFLSALLFITVFTAACKDKKTVFDSFTGFAQGSTYSIIYENRQNIRPEELKIKVDKLLHDFDMSLSTYNDSSIISRINRNENVLTDLYFNEVFTKSQYISEITDGAFDITVGPLVRAWGFGPDEHKNFSESKHDSLMNLVGMNKVSLRNERLIKSNPGIYLDVSALAPGYSVDLICQLLDGLKIKNYLVELSGEVRGKGTKAGAHWRIGIDKPIDNISSGQKLQAIVNLSDKALSTSGNYRRFYIEDGIKYSHEIDPKTGYPAKNTLLSATILAGDCAMADAIATACMVMGKEKTIEFLGEHTEFSAFLIYSDESGNFKTWISPKLESSISETEKEK
jgi:thiamine biosynthesis lipoprotein